MIPHIVVKELHKEKKKEGKGLSPKNIHIVL